jgi:hypothetical protein
MNYYIMTLFFLSLEHLSNPVQALLNLKQVLRKDGTITVIEGDHGSAYFYPRSDAAQKAINCQVQLQALHGGNALIGHIFIIKKIPYVLL